MRSRLNSSDEILVAPGVFDGLSAKLAVASGFEALYLSGFSVAGATFGKPDIGLIGLTEMAGAVGRVVDAAGSLPVIADADNGYGGPMNIARTIAAYERAGAACIQLEDQVHPKRCGHMEGKQVVSRAEAAERIRIAVDARTSDETLIMARTDAIATNDLDEALHRAESFLKAGADILFIEAPTSENDMRRICETFPGVPLVANVVEDGKTPRFGRAELQEMGYRIAIYPVTALLHMAHTLREVYSNLKKNRAPSSHRETFQDFNDLVGLGEVNDYVDRIRGVRDD